VKVRKRILTKAKMATTTARLPQELDDLWIAAARKEKTSRSEFLRHALRERAQRVLLVGPEKVKEVFGE